MRGRHTKVHSPWQCTCSADKCTCSARVVRTPRDGPQSADSILLTGVARGAPPMGRRDGTGSRHQGNRRPTALRPPPSRPRPPPPLARSTRCPLRGGHGGAHCQTPQRPLGVGCGPRRPRAPQVELQAAAWTCLQLELCPGPPLRTLRAGLLRGPGRRPRPRQLPVAPRQRGHPPGP